MFYFKHKGQEYGVYFRFVAIPDGWGGVDPHGQTTACILPIKDGVQQTQDAVSVVVTRYYLDPPNKDKGRKAALSALIRDWGAAQCLTAEAERAFSRDAWDAYLLKVGPKERREAHALRMSKRQGA